MPKLPTKKLKIKIFLAGQVFFCFWLQGKKQNKEASLFKVLMKYIVWSEILWFGAIQPENQLEIQPEKDINEQHSKLVLRTTRDGSDMLRTFSQSSPAIALQIIKMVEVRKESTKKISQCCLFMLISSRQKDSIAIRSNHQIQV